MKKVILGSIAVVAIAAMAAFNVNLNSQSDNLSALSLANVEALATESNDNTNPCKWKQVSCGVFSGSYESCVTSGDGNSCKCGQVTRDCCLMSWMGIKIPSISQFITI